MIRHCSLILICTLLLASTSVQANSRPQLTAEERSQLAAQIANEGNGFEDRFDAEVWLLDMSQRIQRRVKDNKKRLLILKTVHREAKRHNLQPELVLAVIETESNFDSWALSVANARGLMQVMGFWKKEIGSEGDSLFDIETNIRYGTTILKHYLDREKGDLVRALARYNGSLGKRKYPEKVMRKWDRNWR